VPESRKIARLLLDHAEKDTWHNSIQVKNILQKRSPATAKRQTKLIRKVKTIDYHETTEGYEVRALPGEATKIRLTARVMALSYSYSRSYGRCLWNEITL